MKIELKNISLEYAGKDILLKNVHLTINQGDFIVIQGPSGVGKSSLLRLINRLNEPSSGEIFIDGKLIGDCDATRIRRKIGYVQQSPVMFSGSVQDNFNRVFTYASAGKKQAPSLEALSQKLDDFLLGDVTLDSEAAKLSVGQKQRIALIRTMLANPHVLLCDEPTSALDEKSKKLVEDCMKRICREDKRTVVLVTHVAFDAGEINSRRFELSKDKGLEEIAP